MTIDEPMYLHTLDTEAHEAAVLAAKDSLRRSDLVNDARLKELAEQDGGGAVSEAAQALLEEGGAPHKRAYLELRIDVTDLTERQRGSLAGHLTAQTEAR